MNLAQQDLIQKTERFVRDKMSQDATGHDWWHVDRVRRMAVYLCQHEGGDPFLVELTALLHDLDDWKFRTGESEPHAPIRDWLVSHSTAPETIKTIVELIDRISFKGAGVEDEMPMLEGQLVQDADRLDAIGAIGIARCFAFGGSRDRAIYDPTDPPERHQSFDDYQKKSGPSINHFYEKLLLLKDRLHTETARQIAEQRHAVLEQFLQQFHAEWSFPNGID